MPEGPYKWMRGRSKDIRKKKVERFLRGKLIKFRNNKVKVVITPENKSAVPEKLSKLTVMVKNGGVVVVIVSPNGDRTQVSPYQNII